MKTKNPITHVVRIISQTSESSLVEYIADGAVNRCYVPTVKINELKVTEPTLQAGIPYGYPWEDIELKFDAKKFANHLRQNNIWTTQDALRNPNKLWGALRAALSETLSTVLNVAHAENKRS